MKRFALLPCVLLVAACSAFKDPSGAIVDVQGVDPKQYEIDLEDCQRYADVAPMPPGPGYGVLKRALFG